MTLLQSDMDNFSNWDYLSEWRFWEGTSSDM